MAGNPLTEAEAGNVQLDRRHDRRALTPADLLRLFETTKASTKRISHMVGPDRYMLYHTACGTGFRAAELASLAPESFALDADPSTVTVGAAYAKNKKTATQPLPAGLAAELRDYLRGKPAGKPVWPGSWRVRAADVLKVDLEAAGIPYEVPGPDGPLFADFHALRHTYVTMLGEAGATPRRRRTWPGTAPPG